MISFIGDDRSASVTRYLIKKLTLSFDIRLTISSPGTVSVCETRCNRWLFIKLFLSPYVGQTGIEVTMSKEIDSGFELYSTIVRTGFFALVVGLTVTAFATVGAAETQIDECGTLESSGMGEDLFQLTGDIETDDETCFEIQNEGVGDVVFDGMGHTINGSGSADSTGIHVRPVAFTQNVQIKNVTVANFGTGVEFDDVVNSEARDITVRFTETAVSVNESTNVSVEDSTLEGTDRGVIVQNSKDTEVRGNLVDNTFVITTPIDPDPISSLDSDSDASQSESMEPLDTGPEDGINLAGSNDSAVEDNTVRNFNRSGVFLRGQERTLVSGNNVIENGNGIATLGTSDSEVAENDVTDNEGEGITLGASEEDTITENTVARNENGVLVQSFFGENASDNVVTENEVTNNSGIGIYLFESVYNEVTENTANENAVSGIRLDGAGDNVLTGNNASDNFNGINLIGSSDGNTLTDNEANENDGSGIRLFDSSTSNEINENTLVDNDRGIDLEDQSEDNVLTGNDVLENHEGIRLRDSGYNTLAANTATGNEWGVVVTDSHENSLSNNMVTDNDAGIALTGSDDNSLDSNTASDNVVEWDFLVEESSDTEVQNLDIGESTASDTTLSFEAEEVSLSSVDDPEETPDDLAAIDRYFEAESLSEDAFIDVELQYDDGDVSGVNESTLELLRNDGTDWVEVPGSEVDTTENTVTANITEFSDFGAFGEVDEEDEPLENPFFDEDGEPLERGEVSSRIFSWLQDDEIDGVEYKQEDVSGFIFEWLQATD